jgi:hypothetical protein
LRDSNAYVRQMDSRIGNISHHHLWLPKTATVDRKAAGCAPGSMQHGRLSCDLRSGAEMLSIQRIFRGLP